MPAERDGITQYSIAEVKQILSAGTARVIDVRTAEEYEEAHIPGVPLKPLQAVAEWMGELNPKDPYVFVCRGGTRSQKVATVLQENGFTNVANCVGGMTAWDGDVKAGSDL